jgi:hypothetical protein
VGKGLRSRLEAQSSRSPHPGARYWKELKAFSSFSIPGAEPPCFLPLFTRGRIQGPPAVDQLIPPWLSKGESSVPDSQPSPFRPLYALFEGVKGTETG